MNDHAKTLKFVGRLEKSDNKLWGAHVVVPARIAGQLVSGTSRRVLRTLNGSEEHQCALLPFAKGLFVISVNKQWCATLGLEIGSKIRVSLRKDKSKYGLPVPAEFAECLRQDKEGHRLFHALTAGRQRTLLYILGTPADPHIRAWKAAVVIRHLKENAGTINYRQLNESLKPRRLR